MFPTSTRSGAQGTARVSNTIEEKRVGCGHSHHLHPSHRISQILNIDREIFRHRHKHRTDITPAWHMTAKLGPGLSSTARETSEGFLGTFKQRRGVCRHQDTGKPRGFAFLAYEDQRSTVLAVDNLNGCRVNARTITVDHVDNYKRKRAEVPPPPPLPLLSRSPP